MDEFCPVFLILITGLYKSGFSEPEGNRGYLHHPLFIMPALMNAGLKYPLPSAFLAANIMSQYLLVQNTVYSFL